MALPRGEMCCTVDPSTEPTLAVNKNHSISSRAGSSLSRFRNRRKEASGFGRSVSVLLDCFLWLEGFGEAEVEGESQKPTFTFLFANKDFDRKQGRGEG